MNVQPDRSQSLPVAVAVAVAAVAAVAPLTSRRPRSRIFARSSFVWLLLLFCVSNPSLPVIGTYRKTQTAKQENNTENTETKGEQKANRFFQNSTTASPVFFRYLSLAILQFRYRYFIYRRPPWLCLFTDSDPLFPRAVMLFCRNPR